MAKEIVIDKLKIPEEHKDLIRIVALKVEAARESGSTGEVVKLMDTVSIMWALCENAHEAMCGRAW
jgi:hypothetical protein